MERSATVARTNLADAETNVNRLRVPQFGIVSLCLTASGKASKTYLQAGAKAPAAGTDDFHFVPDKEAIGIEYELDDPGAIVDEGKLELFGRFDADPLWTLDLEKLGPSWLSHGKHEIKWDGRIVKAAELPGKVAGGKTSHDLTSLEVKETDKFPDGYVTLEHSPYKLKLTVKSGVLPKKKVLAWTYLQIVLKSIALELGPEEAIPKAWFGGKRLEMDKKVRKQIETDGGLPAAAAIRKVHLPSNLFKTSGGQMDDNTAFDLYKKLWGDGPNIPVIAKIRLADSNDAEVKLESDKGAVALGNARFLWEWEDAAEVATNAAGSKPKAFIDAAIDYYQAGADARSASKDHTYPKGDNCHVDRGGKRGPDAEPVFPKQSGYKPKDPLDAGEFPFKVEACKERLWASFSRGWGKGKLGGRTGALFQPSRMAGDNYKIRVFLAWDHDKDGKYTLDVKTEPLAAAASIQAETGELQIWRELHVVRYIRKQAAIADFVAANLGAIQGHYRKAYVEVVDKMTPATDKYTMADHRFSNGTTPDYNQLCRDLLDDTGNVLFKQHIAVDAAANHAGDGAMFLLRLYGPFVQQVHLHLHGAVGGPDVATAAGIAAMTPDAFSRALGTMPVGAWPSNPMLNRLKATRAWLVANGLDTEADYSNFFTFLLPFDPLLNKLKLLSGHQTGATNEAADGITIIHFDHLNNVVRGCVAAGMGVQVLNGAAVDPGDASHERCAFVLFVNRVDTFVHEIGHHLFLPHAKYPLASPPGGAQANRHDDDDDKCIMSYSPARTAFCGLCQLRLRGWSADALDKDDANNKKP